MSHERDERWVYVALAILAVAYVAYTFRDSLDLSRISFAWVRKLGGTIPYVAATFFGVFFQLWNKKRVEKVRKVWEAGIRAEGLLRQGLDLKVAFADGMKGSLRADVFLTRSALYLFDRGGRRDPMRLPLVPSSSQDPAVVGASLGPTEDQGMRAVRIRVQGPSPFDIVFRSPDADGWRIDVRRVVGRAGSPAALDDGGQEPGPDEAPAGPRGLWSG